MKYSEFKAALPESKRASDPLWARWVLRPLSLPMAWILYRMGLSANSVTLSCILLSIIAALFLGIGTQGLAVSGALIFSIVALGDCVDGNIARATEKTGPRGEWMDALCGYTVYAVLPLALGFRAESCYALEQLPGFWVLLGAVMSSANLYMRVIHQKYVSMALQSSDSNGNTANKGSLIKRISGEAGMVGWMMPFLFLSVVMGLEWLFLILYSFFYLATATGITGNLVLKVIRQG